MKLYHCTHKSNLPSIMANGLDPEKARMKRRSVWGVVRTRAAWAVLHVMAKPWNRDAKLSDLVVIEFSIPRASIRRHAQGMWYSLPEYGCIPVTEDMIRPASDYGKVR